MYGPSAVWGQVLSRKSLGPVSDTDRYVIQKGDDHAPVLRRPSSLIPSSLRKANLADLGSLQRQAMHGELSGQGVWLGEPLGVKTLRNGYSLSPGAPENMLGKVGRQMGGQGAQGKSCPGACKSSQSVAARSSPPRGLSRGSGGEADGMDWPPPWRL